MMVSKDKSRNLLGNGRNGLQCYLKREFTFPKIGNLELMFVFCAILFETYVL